MIDAVVRWIRPAFEPVFKLSLRPPALPEGVREVRRLKPSRAFLACRYFVAALSSTWALVYLVPIAGLAAYKLGRAGLAIAAGLALLYAAGLGVALVATRIDWELRDYLIGDRSLRVRVGVIVQREVTLSFANIQNVEVAQGPLERLFGFKSLRVSTAGGAGSSEKSGGSHDAVLAGLDDAEGIRDLIMDSLRRHRDAGLGDRDDAHVRSSSQVFDAAVLAEVLEAARALREAAERGGATPTRSG